MLNDLRSKSLLTILITHVRKFLPPSPLVVVALWLRCVKHPHIVLLRFYRVVRRILRPVARQPLFAESFSSSKRSNTNCDSDDHADFYF